jgi:hypothetical protein
MRERARMDVRRGSAGFSQFWKHEAPGVRVGGTWIKYIGRREGESKTEGKGERGRRS